MRGRLLFVGSMVAALALSPAAAFKYKIKDLQIKPAREYAAFQDFQNLAIGAYPCVGQERTQELFDTDKLVKRGFLTVLVVIDNSNDFPITLDETDIFLVDPQGQRYPRVPAFEVLLSAALDKEPSTYGNARSLLRKVDENMRLDFEHKAFGEKLIAPHSSDYGVVFFKLPEGQDLTGYHLYFPTIVNFSTGDGLIFFEFELKDAK